MKSFHLPLPEQTYARLRAEADQARLPATTVAPEVIESWLKDRARQARHDAIAAFAAEMAARHSTPTAISGQPELNTWRGTTGDGHETGRGRLSRSRAEIQSHDGFSQTPA